MAERYLPYHHICQKKTRDSLQQEKYLFQKQLFPEKYNAQNLKSRVMF